MTLEAEVPDIQQHHLRSQSNGGQHEANGTQSAWYLPWMDYVSSDGDDSSAVRPTPYTDDTSARVRDSISQALDQHGAFDAGRRRLLDQRVRQLVNAASVSEALKGLFHRSLNVYIFIGDLLPQAVQTSDHLLLAAFLAGAAYTYPSDLYFLITTLYDAAEAFIFEEITCRIGSVDKRGNIESMSGNEQESFGLLMSGILMSYFQLSQYHDEVSLRMREVRFPKLLELARQMSIFDLPKPLSGVDGSPNDMLGSRNIRCRLAFSIFLMDSEFFIFWRGTSRLSLSDMRIELPSGPSRTVATTAVDSIKVIQCFSGRRMSVVLDELLSPTTTIETLSHKLNTSVIGLGLISMALIRLVKTHATCAFTEYKLSILRRAVNLLEGLWMKQISEKSDMSTVERAYVLVGDDLMWLLGVLVHSPPEAISTFWKKMNEADYLTTFLSKMQPEM